MKKDDLIPQYLQDELKSLVNVKATYTDEEIAQVKRDHEHVLEQRKQLEEAEKYGAIPEKEAAITGLTLLVKQFLIEETMRDMLRYLKGKMDAAEEKIREFKRCN